MSMRMTGIWKTSRSAVDPWYLKHMRLNFFSFFFYISRFFLCFNFRDFFCFFSIFRDFLCFLIFRDFFLKLFVFFLEIIRFSKNFLQNLANRIISRKNTNNFKKKIAKNKKTQKISKYRKKNKKNLEKKKKKSRNIEKKKGKKSLWIIQKMCMKSAVKTPYL